METLYLLRSKKCRLMLFAVVLLVSACRGDRLYVDQMEDAGTPDAGALPDGGVHPTLTCGYSSLLYGNPGPGRLDLLAGALGGAGYVDGVGNAARFDWPSGITIDNLGNAYVADWGNSTIRKISPGGIVTTLAGTAGCMGSEDGTGVAARFGAPAGIAIDSTGNLYVADSYNDTIRKITPAGVVSTLAGSTENSGSADGTGATALFNQPTGLAVDSNRIVYVADTSNHTIRKITPGGIVTTLAGSPENSGSTDGTGSAARFNNPGGVALDSVGNLYVSDTENHTIRKVTPTGVVSTIAGMPGVDGSTDGTRSTARFSYPYGVVVDSVGNIYVADHGNYAIRKITPDGDVTTPAGTSVWPILASTDGTGSAARFHTPAGAAIDGAGNVYVVDTGNSTIRKISQAGVVTTVAGSAGVYGNTDGTGAAARFFQPRGLAVDSTGNLYVADLYNHTIRKVTPGGIVTTLAGAPGGSGSTDGTGALARFFLPQGIAVDGAGNIYVADSYNQTIRKVTPGGVVTTLAGAPGVSGSADGTGNAARFNNPWGIAVDSSGNLYVGDSQNDTIRKITPAGVVTTLAGKAGSQGSNDGTGAHSRFTSPTGVALDSSGNLYVADDILIRKITPAGMVTTVVGRSDVPFLTSGPLPAGLGYYSTGIAMAPSGDLIVTSLDAVVRITF